MDLSLRQLRAYAAVARAGSFTAAARELRVSQSALSRTVAELERRMRVRLLERDTRKVALTAHGEELLRTAEHVLDVHDSELRRLERYLAGESGTVTIATLPSVAAVLLPGVVATFRRKRPDIGVRILDGLARTVLDRVTAGEADLAITIAEDLPSGLRATPLVRDRFYAALPPEHPLAGCDRLTWARLAAEPFIAIGTDSSVRLFTDRAFTRAGAAPARVIEAGNVATVGGLIAARLGTSALPALVRALMSFTDLAHRPLTDPEVDRGLSVVLPADRTLPPPAARFLDLLDALPATAHELPAGVTWAT